MDFQGISGNFTEAGVDALAITLFKDEKASSGLINATDAGSYPNLRTFTFSFSTRY